MFCDYVSTFICVTLTVPCRACGLLQLAVGFKITRIELVFVVAAAEWT